MYLRATLTVALLATGLALANGAPAAPGKHLCDRSGSTVVKNHVVRVYLDEDFFACSYETGRVRELGFVASSSAGFYDAFGFVLAGRFIAYHRVECSNGCEVDDLRVIDMGRDKQTMRHRFGDDEGPGTIVLKANGSVAFLAVKTDRSGAVAGVTLHRRDRRGRWALATGAGDSAPRALRLVGSTLHWREGERERTKTLQ